MHPNVSLLAIFFVSCWGNEKLRDTALAIVYQSSLNDIGSSSRTFKDFNTVVIPFVTDVKHRSPSFVKNSIRFEFNVTIPPWLLTFYE